MYPFWITIQSIAIIGSVAAGFYILRQKNSYEQTLLILLSVCVFFENYCYLKIILSVNQDLAIAYQQVSFIPEVCIGFIFIDFFSSYIGKPIPRHYYLMLLVDCIAVSLASNLPSFNDWYCSDFTYDFSHGIVAISYSHGWLYYVDFILSAAGLIYVFVMAVRERHRCKDSHEKLRISGLEGILILVGGCYLLSELFMPKYIRVFPAVTSLGLVMFLILITRYGMIDVIATVRERVFDTMPEATIVVDENLKVKDFNGNAARFFPEISEAKGKDFPLKYHYIVENFDDTLSFKHDGRHLERHMSPVYYRGKVTGYSIVLIDVTRTHQMLLQMQNLKKQADAASLSKSSFLANMSHEIRTPMNAIVGFSELMLKEKLEPTVVGYAKTIKTSANSLLHIINDILDFSKIEQGKLEIVEEEYTTEALFEEVADIMSIPINKKGLRFVMTIAPDIPCLLYGDRLRIRQVLINIINNAVKFTKEGHIRMTVEWERENHDTSMLTIIISDSGIGIKKEDMERLFKEFEQADVRQNRGVEGTGLGLSISRSLLHLMGGDIKVESEYGVGTSVIITLRQKIVDPTPMSKFAEGSLGAKQEDNGGRIIAPDAKILVVDDNRINLELMKNCLKQYRITPELADSGRASIELVRENDYDIIFMDQMMPEMDGVTAMKTIRALEPERTEKLNIIALTANAIAGTKNQLIGEGFTDYLAKPVPLKALEAILLMYIPEGKRMRFADESEVGSEQVRKQNEDSDSLRNQLEAEKKLKNHGIKSVPDYIDIEEGIENCGGDVESFFTSVQIVCKYVPEKLEAIRQFLEEKNYERYVIEVHALKSNAATVGAVRLSSRARELEMAGKNGKFDVIEADNGKILESFELLIDDLEQMLSDNESEPDNNESASLEAIKDTAPVSHGNLIPTEESEYLDTFKEINECIKEGKYVEALDLFHVLDFFELPDDVRARLDEMRGMAEREEWGNILERGGVS